MTPQEFKQIRVTIGMSQRQLATKLNVLTDHISKLENGKRGITEQKEEALKMLLREYRLRNKNSARVHFKGVTNGI